MQVCYFFLPPAAKTLGDIKLQPPHFVLANAIIEPASMRMQLSVFATKFGLHISKFRINSEII